MTLFEDFSPQTYDQWKASVDRELKGLSFEETLTKKDEIEELDYSKFNNLSRANSSEKLTYSRATSSNNNDWLIGKRIEVKDEKVANKMALLALNQGANALTFILQKTNILWEALFENIGLDYIACQFETLDEEQSQNLSKTYPSFCKKPLILLNDPIGVSSTFILPEREQAGTVLFKVNAYGLHQTGANATQEIAFALSMGHEYLHRLLAGGFSIDDASAMIRFDFGIGSNYFIEATKFRVFRKLWANIVTSYHPQENCSHACYIYAQTGFVNKSLKDPYTNLLRQSTEVMSAVLGGANEIIVRAYDEYAKEKEANLGERMALNISNILKEESYFDKVIDPLGGSYSLENLASILEEKAWSLFQNIEKKGGISYHEGKNHLQSKVEKTAQKRMDKLKSGERLLIGVNKYPNPDEKANQWQDIPPYFGLEALILEKHKA